MWQIVEQIKKIVYRGHAVFKYHLIRHLNEAAVPCFVNFSKQSLWVFLDPPVCLMGNRAGQWKGGRTKSANNRCPVTLIRIKAQRQLENVLNSSFIDPHKFMELWRRYLSRKPDASIPSVVDPHKFVELWRRYLSRKPDASIPSVVDPHKFMELWRRYLSRKPDASIPSVVDPHKFVELWRRYLSRKPDASIPSVVDPHKFMELWRRYLSRKPDASAPSVVDPHKFMELWRRYLSRKLMLVRKIRGINGKRSQRKKKNQQFSYKNTKIVSMRLKFFSNICSTSNIFPSFKKDLILSFL